MLPVLNVTRSIETASPALRLSPRQRYVWRLPRPIARFGVWTVFEVTGAIDMADLRDAVDMSLAPHDVLRTTFLHGVGDESPHARVTDLGARWIPAEATSPEALVRQLRSEPFDLDHGPIVHASIAPLDDRCLLGLGGSALCADAMTLQLLATDALRRCAGEPSLSASVPYVDIARWLDGLLEAESGQAGRDYWTAPESGCGSEGLSWLQGAANSPAVHLRSPDAPLDRTIAAVAARLQTTESTVLLASWLALLQRVAPHAPPVVNVQVDGRTFEELTGICGPLTQYLPVRAQVAATAAFDIHVRSLHEQLAQHASRLHYFAPPVPGNGSRERLGFIYEDRRWRYRAGPLEMRAVAAEMCEEDFRLALHVVRSDAGLTVACERSGAAAADCERLVEEFQAIVASAIRDPHRPTDRLSAVGIIERASLLTQGQATRGEPDQTTVDRLIAAYAYRKPQAVAVVCGDRQMTFGELNAEVDMLAAFLAERGVGPERRVGVLIERSPEMVIAVLGILRCGGAFVPLDVAMGQARLDMIVADAGLDLVLTQTSRRFRLSRAGTRIVCLDSDREEIHRAGQHPRPPLVTRDTLAYVLYTSGSTGTPKGVMATHGGLTNYLRWACNAYRVEAGVGAPVHSSIAFDLTITSLLCPLMAGRAVYLVPEEDAIDELIQTLRSDREFSLVKITPAHARLVHALTNGDRLARIGALVIGGEELSGPLAAAWRSSLPGTRIINEYGPTETVVGCCVYEVCDGDSLDGTVPIGRAIQDTQLYVLDADLDLAPTHAAGELCVAGAGVARGYLNDPALTAAKFRPNPFSDVPGSRLYRTGDLVRRLPDGNLEFLGRIDSQVKIRGFRVELGGIAATLARHEAIQEARVIAAPSAAGHQQLIAYLVLQPESSLTPSALRAWLADRIADYMMPAAFVVVDELPLTANGKLDTDRLPGPTSAWMNTTEQPVPPRTAAEQALASIWSALLGRDSIGVHDNFFELGGDSIAAIQVIARAAVAGLRVSLRDMFRHQTIAELAAVAQQQEAAASMVSVPYAPLLPLQQWFFSSLPDSPHLWTQSVIVSLRAHHDASAMERTVRAICAHHDVFGLVFHETSSGWEQRLAAAGGQVLFETHDLSSLPALALNDAIREAAEQMRCRFDLCAGPHAGAIFFVNSADGIDRLALIVHHLIIDAVSWPLLVTELDDQLSAAAPMQPAAASLACARRLDDRAQEADVAAELEYWVSQARSQVAPLTPLALRSGGIPPSVSVDLDSAMTAALENTARLLDAPLNALFLTALLRVFAEACGVQSLLVDVEGHGRDDIANDVPGTPAIGAFTAVYPLLLAFPGPLMSGEATPAIVRAVSQQLDETPNGGIGYGLLRYLSRSRAPAIALGAMPQADVLFNYLGTLDRVPASDRTNLSDVRELTLTRAIPQRHRFSVGIRISEGRLLLTWSCRDIETPALTAGALAAAYQRELQLLCKDAQLHEARSDEPGIESKHPVSELQAAMLLHSLAAPGAGAYFEQASCRLENIADVGALIDSWKIVIDRHAALRSAFVQGPDGGFQQVVHTRVQLPVREEDWTSLPAAEQQSRLGDFRTADRAAGFDLAQAPLVRLALFRLRDRDWQFTLSFHHAVLDGWSTHLVLREVLTLYQGRLDGGSPELPPVRPFRDYITWLGQQPLTEADRYWRQLLAGYKAPVRIAQAAARVVTRSDERQEAAILPEDVSVALSAMAQRERLTLGSILQGAWALTLGEYTGERDIVFGLVTSGRSAPIPGIETMVGLLMNTNPVRIRIRGNAVLIDWLKEIQDRRIQALEYEHTPMTAIRAASEVDGALPLFESVLVCENYPTGSRASLAHSDFRIVELQLQESTGVPLTLVAAADRSLALRLAYDSAVIDPLAARRLMTHLTAVLSTIANSPRIRLAALPTTDPGVAARLQLSKDRLCLPAPMPRCLHEWFEEQAVRSPEAQAVTHEGRTISYRELDHLANAVATRLLDSGVNPDSRVGLLFAPSFAMIGAMIGVLKAGCCYLPIDPDCPRERIDWILNDASPAVILTQQHLIALVPDRCLALAIEEDERAAAPPAPDLPVDPQQLAYIIYTSGSTGRPKGVQIPHEAVSRLFLATADLFQLGSGDVWTLFHSYAFDFSVWEVWGALLFGGRIVIVPQWMRRSPGDFHQLLLDSGVTVLNQTPSALRMLVGASSVEAEAPSLGSVRLLISGGEALDPYILAPWFDRHLACRVVNMYGITETTVHVTHRDVAMCDVTGSPRSCIGEALPGLTLHVLGHDMRPSPTGVPGEIHVGGAQLGRGYLGRPALTAERFVPDPFSEQPGARLYRSGDLAVWHEDGELEYLGRRDRQVKIRGFRIEPAEVETALRRCRGVRDAIVIEDRTAGESRLAAYVVMDGAHSIQDVRQELSELLPAHMTPAILTPMAELPLTPHGKVDIAALPAPTAGRDEAQIFVEPRLEAERTLALIWADVLGVPRVGIHDNFFALGGDSIASLQIASRGRQAGLPITPASLFTHPTIAELVRAEPSASAAHDARSGEEAWGGDAVPLTPVQRWFFEQDIANPHFWNQSLLLRVYPELSRTTLEAAFQALARQHTVFGHRFVRDNAGWRQMCGGDAMPTVTAVDLGAVPQRHRHATIEACAAQAHASLDLTHGPLWRALLFTGARAEPAWLFLTAHHLVVDTVSWRILLEDLETACEQFERQPGAPIQLPPATASYKAWACALSRQADTFHETSEGRGWLESTAIELPARGRQSAQPNIEGSRRAHRQEFSTEETATLTSVSARFDAAVEHALLAILGAAWQRWSHEDVLFVDLEHHGRDMGFNGVDVSRTVGWFTTITPLLLRIPPKATPLLVLEEVARSVRAIPHHGIGYGLLRYLRADTAADLAARAQPEIAFNYLGHLDRPNRRSRLAMSRDLAAASRDPQARRTHLIEVGAGIAEGRLRVTLYYSQHVHCEASIRTFSAHFREMLGALLAECQSTAYSHHQNVFR